jgi:site-specific DNA recombinase
VIELHPQAVELFKQNLEALADILGTKDALPDPELVGTFRSLVESVVVRPRKAGEQHEVSIRGYLASLMGAEVSALLMVAGARSGINPRQELPVFSMECVGM